MRKKGLVSCSKKIENKMITYPIFKEFPDIYAFTTTKKQGLHALSRFTGEEVSLVQHSKDQLCRELGIDPSNLVFPRQTHSSNVKLLESLPEHEITDTDALITSKPGICICVQTADCVPLIIYDPKHHAAAVIHAGWRGTYSEIAGITVKTMSKEFKSSPSELVAVIGPSIGSGFYEIGNEVADLFIGKYGDWKDLIINSEFQRPHLDLWELNRLQLLRVGLHQSSISLYGKCTYENHDLFYSARREGVETGRMATGIILKHRNMNTIF